MDNYIKLICVLLASSFLLTGCQFLPKKENQTMEPQQNIAPSTPPPPPIISVHFIDVGFGESILIETPDKTALIDCGPDDQRILAHLMQQNIRNIDMLISTHNNVENIGGCDNVIKNIEVGEFFDSGEKSGIPAYIDMMYEIGDKAHKVVKEGDSLNLGVVQLHILNPKSISFDTSLNALVIKLNYNNINVLFTGDCVEECEHNLLGKEIEDINVLKVGYFCSKKSTLSDFLDTTNPRVAILFAGPNEFGYPDISCIERIIKEGITLFRTDEDGTIVLETDGLSVWKRGSSLMWS